MSQPASVNILKYCKLNLASSTTPDLQHYTCSYNLEDLHVKNRRGTTFQKFKLWCTLH